MGAAGAKRAQSESKSLWPDSRLVQHCLRGDEAAWMALVNKYKNLIYSIPAKLGFSQDDCSDIFQAVCVELISQLPQLRKPQALAAWLIKVTAHRCSQWERQASRFVDSESQPEPTAVDSLPDTVLSEVQNEQILRTALRELPPRCHQLIQMLFFEASPRPYHDVARELGIATGSIGFIRGRCLEKLRRRLEEMGFR
jgi:RNA polymerase sigma factor (sigma-70 family)